MLVDRTGERYGSLVVLSREGSTSAGNVKWRCRCDCGNETVTVGTELSRGVRSCGKGECHSRKGSAGERSPVWTGDSVGYVGAHTRVRRERGSAGEHPCADCEYPADQWAYDNADPDEKRDGKGRAYSPNPSHYLALCKVCHLKRDYGRRTGRTFETEGGM